MAANKIGHREISPHNRGVERGLYFGSTMSVSSGSLRSFEVCGFEIVREKKCETGFQ